MTQHADLSAARWSAFTRTQQVLQIAVEMHRATHLVESGELRPARLAYERVLQLLDLTVEVTSSPAWRRELLNWRTFVGALYLASPPDPRSHRVALRTLLQMDPVAKGQIAALGI